MLNDILLLFKILIQFLYIFLLFY